MHSLRDSLLHPDIDASIDNLSRDERFNVAAKLGKVLGMRCRLVAFQRAVNYALR